MKSENVSFNHVKIKDGVINSKYSEIRIQNTEIIIDNRPMKIGDKRPSIIWSWHGQVELNNISLIGNGEGEGVNISYADSKITNSKFYYTPDAIELINVEKGEISNNIVMFSPDDAIDLNDCSNIVIKENVLLHNTDKGISIGTDWNNKFVASKTGFNRKSSNILINNNYIMGNQTGLSIKDSSFVKANNNIISFNEIGIQLYKKYEKYMLGGILDAETNVVNQNTANFSVDTFSKILGQNIVDSLYILPTENFFFIPSLINYKIKNQTITLENKSNIYFELSGLSLLDEHKQVLFKFYKNHNIAPNQSIKIGPQQDLQHKNYFYTSKLNLEHCNQIYVKDKRNRISILKDE